MKFLTTNKGYIVTAIIAISVTVVFFLLFFKPKQSSGFDKQMELYDTLLNRERENTRQERERYDKIIDELLKQDSAKQVQVTATKQRINETPNRINSLDRESFRREFTEF